MPSSGPPVSDEDVAKARELREALRTLLAAHNGIGRVDVGRLNVATEGLTLSVGFQPDEAIALRPAAEGVTGALAELIGVVYTAVTDGTWNRIKVCREDTCRWAYYDSSKNRSAAWCSMAVCGNRAKARAYRARAGATTSTP